MLRHKNIIAWTHGPDDREYPLFGLPCPLSGEARRPRIAPSCMPAPRLLLCGEGEGPDGNMYPRFACPICGARFFLEPEEARLVLRAVRSLIRRKFGPEPVDAAALRAGERTEYAELRCLAEYIRGVEIHG